MTDQLPVTLDDLKRAIEALPDPQSTHPEAYLHKNLEARAKAWRTAFEWREGWYAKMLAAMHRAAGDISIIEEGAEGMRLIRERLR